MRHNLQEINRIDKKLQYYENQARQLPGISSNQSRECFIKQIIDSIRRIEYVRRIKNMNVDINSSKPSITSFNPIKASTWNIQNGNIEEAFWLVLLLTHFGKHKTKKWRLVNDIYSGLTNSIKWDWNEINQNMNTFKVWLNDNILILKENGGFGNHRKYQSLNPYSNAGTGATIESYINWIESFGTHQVMVNYINENYQNPREGFSFLYNSMSSVIGFGRTAKFDYLTMVGKIGLMNVEPNSTYMIGSTGPFTGARMLFGVRENARVLDEWLIELESSLGLYFGMQTLEDSICNWQKKPNRYIYFGG